MVVFNVDSIVQCAALVSVTVLWSNERVGRDLIDQQAEQSELVISTFIKESGP
jgi:hypothetical protein